MTCSCNAPIFDTDYSTIVCSKCGIETKVGLKLALPSSDSYNTHTPFFIGYSRSKRFETMLNAVFRPTPVKADDQVLEFLFKSAPIHNMGHLFRLLKKNKAKDKRYCSLHLFSKLFVKNYNAPQVPLECVHKGIIQRFKDIEFLHMRYLTGPFFNYCYLLRRFLLYARLEDHVKFVKRLKCPRRCRVYDQMFEKLLNLSRTSAEALEGASDSPL